MRAAEPAAGLLLTHDRAVASKSTSAVAWSDEYSADMDDQAGPAADLMESRVKSTVITAFSARDLLFYACLALAGLAVLYGATRQPTAGKET